MMKLTPTSFIFTLLITGISLTAASCDPYRKMAQSENIAERDSAAMAYFNKGKYDQALYLFEGLTALYVNDAERQEDMYYYYALSRYRMGELVSASYFLDDFMRRYPNSDRREEVAFLKAKSYYELSDPYYLDQGYTYRAIEELQLFLSRHPFSKREEQVNEMLTTLRERLARKAFEQASLYQKIGNYRSAVESFQTMIDEFPDSKFREEAQFRMVQSSYQLAQVSIDRLKVERYEQTDRYSVRFVDKFPNSKFAAQARKLGEDSKQSAEQIRLQELEVEAENLYLTFRDAIRIAADRKGSRTGEEKLREANTAYDELKQRFPETEWWKKAEQVYQKYETEI